MAVLVNVVLGTNFTFFCVLVWRNTAHQKADLLYYFQFHVPVSLSN